MSYRIHRGMGWGMPISRFEELCRLPKDEDGVTESLYTAFSRLGDEDLTVDDNIYRALFYGDGLKPYPILQKRLLATGYDDPSPAGRATNLYTFVSTPDETTDVMFFPSLWYHSKWYRWDDDLDYAFERHRDDEGIPRDFTKYVQFGHYPWQNSITDTDGNPIEWTHYTLLGKRDDWLPAVPSEIRWYLIQHSILDNAGVNELRPLIAQWWS